MEDTVYVLKLFPYYVQLLFLVAGDNSYIWVFCLSGILSAWTNLHNRSPLGITRGQKAEIWQECCLGGHLTWVKRNFRNSHFYPHFWAENSKISPQKCDTCNKLCSVSESLGVRKLKIGMRGDYISISKCTKGFFEIHNFTPFLGPKTPTFCFKNVEFCNHQRQQ